MQIFENKIRVKILTITLIMVLTGFIFIFSSGSMQAVRLGKAETYFFFKQFFFAIIGFTVMGVTSFIPLNFYRKSVFYIYLITLCLLVGVFLFPKINGAHRWLVFPFMNFQPSELAKFTTILYFAHYLDKKQDKLKDLASGFLPATIMLGILTSLIMAEPDFGTTFLLLIISFTLFFVGGAKITHLLGVVGLTVPVLVTLVLMGGYRKARFISFLDPWQYSNKEGYQLIQSLTAVGSGGIFGKGLGNSSQKLFFLPEAHTDFIFSIISEEFGLTGSVFVILLLVGLFYLIVKISSLHKDKFKRLLTLGIGLMIIYQAVMHIGVTIGMLPTKGITLPFVSYGGSALVAQLALIGILVRSVGELK